MSQNQLIIISILLLLILTSPVSALELGGEVEVKSGLLFSGQNLEASLQEKLNLELFLPETETTSAKFEIDIATDSISNTSYSQLKKLYLEKNWENFDLTMGRQPVSWSFGSLFNPVDFNLGAEALAQQSEKKNIDGLEFYYPLDWTSSISSALAVENSGDLKYGGRGRTTLAGYDLTANFVTAETGDLDRIAGTIKGDLGSIGVYGAGGYYFKPEQKIMLVGADYSFYHQDIHQVVLQGEYINDRVGLTNYLGSIFSDGNELPTVEIGSELLTTMISYGLDDFSTVKVTTLFHLADSSILLLPTYETQLSDNLDLEFRSGLLLGAKGEVFGSPDSLAGLMELTVSYPF
ncbi:MAG: hypothetical protein ACQEP9_00540 [Bacillota bacterium]